MKRSLIYVLVLAVALTALGIWGINSGTKSADAAGSTVTYWLPYLSTNTTNPTYCMVSNMGASAANTLDTGTAEDNVTAVGFTVMSNTAGTATATAIGTQTTAASYKVPVKKTRMLSFVGQAVMMDTTSIYDLSSDTTSNDSYSGKLTFAAPLTVALSTASVGIRQTFNCTTMAMTCFTGTTSPKRNVVGYSCSDGGFSAGTALVTQTVPGSGIYAY
ncbi:MAG: hypothetical protein L7F77_08910 [Candidatus Magnetominusculus sp. LBB02]|nr:hypothetical protein [Candidatus Magnetominusculus sp. LBB02]